MILNGSSWNGNQRTNEDFGRVEILVREKKRTEDSNKGLGKDKIILNNVASNLGGSIIGTLLSELYFLLGLL